MSEDERPVLVAYDGSTESQEAVRAAATLFPGRRLVVITVWEAGLAMVMSTPPDHLSGLAYVPPSAEAISTVDQAQRDHASELAESGAALARELGATAETHAVPDELNIPETVASVAAEHDAAAVVVGSRGLGQLKSKLLGSTSQGLLQHASRPVVVVRAPDMPTRGDGS